jgi:hypothetical protein
LRFSWLLSENLVGITAIVPNVSRPHLFSFADRFGTGAAGYHERADKEKKE